MMIDFKKEEAPLVSQVNPAVLLTFLWSWDAHPKSVVILRARNIPIDETFWIIVC